MSVDRVALRTRLRTSGRHLEAACAAAIPLPPLSGNEPTGMDAATGRLLTGWPWVVQSAIRVLTTAYFEEVMRPHVGSNARQLFGELAHMRTAQRFRWAVGVAVLLFVPNLRPTAIQQLRADRTGSTGWVAEGDYLPRAHRGDLTSAGRRSLDLVPAGRGGAAIAG
ncbi:hypothetical protein C2U72_14085 [Prosthecomicrobium hirschii]|uniref:hypothetical protein n=1 Tax=Prosthecodimorpha hirschii TaxID=665126 RepID=UPI0011262D1E|nr:hypothetical protein [Prosthecomicrobium hirschii]TPQ50313.1 hypothetical protein C2U72_14085 [Prosthecomicrobium hirschii]